MVLNPGIGRWLQFEIAKQTGVSFGWNFPLQGKLFNQLLHRFEPNFETTGAFKEDLARWHLADILSNLEDRPLFSQIRLYCQSPDTSRRLAFASRLTKLFDEYLVYRPDTIIQWEDQPDSFEWQAEIWRRLISKLFPNQNRPPHIARIWHTLAHSNNSPLTPHPSPFTRIFVFGASSLAPLYLDILDIVSQSCPVHIFLLQPSDLYWADLKTTKDIQKIVKKADQKRSSQDELLLDFSVAKESHYAENELFETGNPLLPAFGKQSQMFLDLLIDKDAQQDDLAFAPPEEVSQLTALQSDLFTITNRDCESGESPFPQYDGTIQIHSCASRRREVETIWDHIVHRLDSDPSLTPSQILVMAPDIQKYRSHIEAIFEAKRDTSLFIPYTIADATTGNRSGVFSGLSILFQTASSRATSADILVLLETPLLREVYRFSDQDLERIEFWIRELGITWGWNSIHREQHDGFATDRNTWAELRSRLSSGLAFSSSIEAPSGFAAYPELEGELSDTAGRLLECLDLLHSLRQNRTQIHMLNTWRDFILSLVSSLRCDREDWQSDYQQVVELIRDTIPDLTGIPANGAEAFQAIQDKLDANASRSGYLSGGVTFCSLKPMRAIPADTICLMGMNRLDFPRSSNRLSFDLMAKQVRIGDRNTRDEDRQFFLETLLSTRSYLFISYQGLASNSDTKKEPSVVIEELLNYLSHAMLPKDFAQIKQQQKRQSFDLVYFQNAPHFTYDPTRATLANTFSHPSSSSSSSSSAPQANASEATTLDLESLIQFFRDPAKAFALNSAKLRFVSDEDPLPISDPLQQDGLDRYQVRQALADAIVQGTPIAQLSANDFTNQKLLPPGLQETPTFLAEQERADTLAKALQIEPATTHFTQVQINDLTLSGTTNLQPNPKNQILVHGGELKAPRVIDAWIRHLFALCSVPEFNSETQVFTLHDKAKHIRLASVESAHSQLQHLVSLYLSGQEQPLPLFPILSKLAFDAWQKEKTDHDAQKREAALYAARRSLASGKSQSAFYRPFEWSNFDRTCFGSQFDLDESYVDLVLNIWQPIHEATSTLKLESTHR